MKDEKVQLQKENQLLKEQVAGLLKRIQELEASRKPSKSRQDAEQGLKMLEAGPVTTKQLAQLNQKYPSDVIYYVRNILKVDVKTVRGPEGTRYMLEKDFVAYHAEKLKKSDSADEATEAIHQAEAQTALAASVAV